MRMRMRMRTRIRIRLGLRIRIPIRICVRMRMRMRICTNLKPCLQRPVGRPRNNETHTTLKRLKSQPLQHRHASPQNAGKKDRCFKSRFGVLRV